MALDWTNVALVGVAVFSAGFNVFQGWRFERHQRARREEVREQNRLTRKHAESMEKIAKTYETEISALRQELEAVKKSAPVRPVDDSMAIKRQELAQKERKLEWEKTRDVVKALWALARDDE